MSPIGDADAPFASGEPFLAVPEPSLLLLALAHDALRGTIGDPDALDAARLRGKFVLADRTRRLPRPDVTCDRAGWWISMAG